MNSIEEFAEILRVIIERGLLNHSDFKHVVGVLIRDAMETKHPHCTTDYRTVKAAEVVAALAPKSKSQYHARCSKKDNKLRHEHMVPTSERIRILAALNNPTVASIAASLKMFGLRATIHVDEDKVLTDEKLKSKMPAAFWIENSDMYMDPLARYKEAKLFDSLRPRQGSCWFTDAQSAL